MTRVGVALFAATLLTTATVEAQSVMERSPNLHGVWGLSHGSAVFVLNHRFEFAGGGDELTSVPTLTLGAGLPLGLTLGLDYTSYSESIPGNRGGNENQIWLKRPFRLSPSFQVAALAAYNHPAESVDGALDVRLASGRFQLFAEGRAFSAIFGSDEAGAAAAIGGSIQLTQHLGISGDFGKVLTEDSVPEAWSAAIAMELPGSPHTLSLVVTNAGATTLHGASREKTLGQSERRYGFTFTVPLDPSRMASIFRPVSVPPPPETAGAQTVQLRQFAFAPAEITIRVGETVEWVNMDPVTHTVTATDRAWDSGNLPEGGRYQRTFTEAGRFTYLCIPHPNMRGTVVVIP
jgi:plastocyanin